MEPVSDQTMSGSPSIGSARNCDENNPPIPPLEKGGKACPELVEGGGFKRFSSTERLFCPAYAIVESRFMNNIIAASKSFLYTIKRKDILPDILYLSLRPCFCCAVVLQAIFMITQGCTFHAIFFKISQTVSRDLITNLFAAHYSKGEGP